MQTHFRMPDPGRTIFPFRKHGRALGVPEARAGITACLLCLGLGFTSPVAAQSSVNAGPPERTSNSAAGSTGSTDSVLIRPPAETSRPARDSLVAAPSFRIYDLDDDKLLRELWARAGRAGEPDAGRYQILAVRTPEAPEVPAMLLLREGTQAGALPEETQAWLRERLSAAQGEGAARTLGSGLWANFWNPFDRLAPYQWETGLTVTARVDGATFPNAKPLFGQHYDLVYTQRPVRWLTTEAGAHVTRQGGGLYRNLYDPFDAGGTRWTRYAPWWHAAIGVPGVKWEVALSNREFPEYVWLDPQAGAGSYQSGLTRAGIPQDTTLYAEALLMKRWRAGSDAPKPSTNNLAHSLHVKAGNFRYMAHFDRDVYRSTIHQLMIEEIRAPFGQWAFGFIAAAGVAHSRMRLDLFPVGGKPGPAGLEARARAHLLRVHFDYRDASTWRLGFSTSLHLDAPFLRPGDTP